MAKVNLDALIPREDFEVSGSNNSGNLFPAIAVSSFQTGLFYPFLRKPDFQRETSEWDAKKICDFLESYINGDLIPSIILWRSESGLYFVIDGAHRLSALISWIYDDYGDGEISQKFYGNDITEEQKNIADETRKMINKQVGCFKDILESTEETEIENTDYLKKATNIGAFSIQVQWIQGNTQKAEQSFFKINQQGVPLNKTEIKLLNSRKKGNCIAARAVIRGGKGHKYWQSFSAQNQIKIQNMGSEIHDLLFSPSLKTPIKSLDLPVSGKTVSAQALPLILDFINIVNQIPNDFEDKIDDDMNGEETIKCLTKARKVAWRINSIHASSLGLHPIIYFYSSDGRHKPASFYAATAWLMEMEKKNNFNAFIKVRKNFEELLLKYDYLIQDINRTYRQATKSFPFIKDFFVECVKLLNQEKDIDCVINEITKNPKFLYLKIRNTDTPESKNGQDTNTGIKSAIYIREAMVNAIRCKICNGLIHSKSTTIDHIQRKEDGGMDSIENGQLAHPYCNSTYKN